MSFLSLIHISVSQLAACMDTSPCDVSPQGYSAPHSLCSLADGQARIPDKTGRTSSQMCIRDSYKPYLNNINTLITELNYKRRFQSIIELDLSLIHICIHTWGDGGIYDHKLQFLNGMTRVLDSHDKPRCV